MAPSPASQPLESSVNMELLRLFVGIAAHGGIAAAARELDLAASVATRKIARLEKALGVRLFQRTTRSIKLTESGAIALHWAQQSLDRYEQMSDELASLQTRPSGTIRLATTHTAGVRFLPMLLKRFCDQHPHIGVSIALTDAPIKLLNESADLAIHSGPVPDGNLVATRLIEFQQVLCASPDYIRLRGVPRKITDLAEHDCLLHTASDTGTWLLMKGNRLVAQKVRSRVTADNLEMLIALARQGFGIARVGRVIANAEISNGTMLQVLPNCKCVYPMGELPGLWLVYPSRRVLYRTRLLIDFLVSTWDTEYGPQWQRRGARA